MALALNNLKRVDMPLNKETKLNQTRTNKFWTMDQWVGKEIWWELCRRLGFDHTAKWYMHKKKSVLEGETHELFWDFEIQADLLVSVKRSDSVGWREKPSLSRGFCCSGRPQSESERRRRNRRVLRLCQRTERAIEHESDCDTNCCWPVWNDLQRFGKVTGGIVNQRKYRDNPDYGIL